jgi:transcription antitermination factor NusG
MKATSFIHVSFMGAFDLLKKAEYVPSTACSQRVSHLSRMWKRPHPSEDGEALQKNLEKKTRPSRHTVQVRITELPQPPHWYALYTTPRHEKRVAQHLGHRQIEFFLPLYRSRRKWRDGSRVTLDLPLFPGYLFIRIQRKERGQVLSVPGALTIVCGTAGEPAPLLETTVEALREGLKERAAQPHPAVAAGQRVRIRSGALAGFEGVVVRNKNSLRVVLTLEQIQKSYSVEVGLEDIEPLTVPGKTVRTVAV